MSGKYTQLICCAVSTLFALALPAAARDIIPAGTILHCTMDEPNFSPKTAMVGDPVLCHLGPLGSFGHSVFPRGAELGGHMQDYKAPGHFFGKGWMAVEFDRLILPNAEMLPLAAKVVSAPHNKVDAQGDIKGKGHPKRDAALWMVPIFWPIKVFTLPARGPYPALKGENRLSLRLMEDVEVPFSTSRYAVPTPPWTNQSGALQTRPLPSIEPASTTVAQSGLPQLAPPQSAPVRTRPLPSVEPGSAAASVSPVIRQAGYTPGARPTAAANADGAVTIIALQEGGALLAHRYWLDGTKMHCVSLTGAEQDVPLNMIDLAQTVKVNQERNVEFALRSKVTVRPAATREQ